VREKNDTEREDYLEGSLTLLFLFFLYIYVDDKKMEKPFSSVPTYKERTRERKKEMFLV
jgi:hypothetical protein